MLDLGNDEVALAFETKENCLIFYKIAFNYGQNKLYLQEIQHVFPRSLVQGFKWTPDPIKKCVNVIHWDNTSEKYAQSGIAIRESGSLDFYYNYRLVEETKGSFKDTIKGYNEARW